MDSRKRYYLFSRMSETQRILSRGYHLKVYICKQIRYNRVDAWSEEQQIEFVNLPSDFKIEQVNSETGVYSPTKDGLQWMKSFFPSKTENRPDYYEEHFTIESIFIEKIKDWHNELNEFVEQN